MLRRSHVFASALLLCALLASRLTFAGDAPKASPDPTAPRQPSAEEAEEGLAAERPGPEHERLQVMVGDFEAEHESHAGPGAPAEFYKGSIKGESLFGGRFVQSHFEGHRKEKPFSGINLIGYDNNKKRYVGTWANSDTTTIQYAEGTPDITGKIITMEMEEKPDPAVTVRIQFIITLVDSDNYTFETNLFITNMKPFMATRIKYKRVKK